MKNSAVGTGASALFLLSLGLLCGLGWIALRGPVSLPVASRAGTVSPAAYRRIEAALGKIPLYFVENRGQRDRQVAYYVEGRDTSVYFTRRGVTFALTARDEAEGEQKERLQPVAWSGLSWRQPPKPTRSTQSWAVKLEFLGANQAVEPVGEERTPAVICYFHGRPGDWRAGLPTYSRIAYSDLWPGIDLVYSGAVNELKYTFVVKPGANPNQIKLEYRGAAAVRVNGQGELELATPSGSLRDKRPYAYQEIEGGRREVTAAYGLEGGGRYGFQIGKYDRSQPLVLDPAMLIYAGYIGGSADDQGVGIAVDAGGNAYVTGLTHSTEATFPVTVGPRLTSSFLGAFVAKVNAAGTALIYADYILGGVGHGIAVDAAGNVYVTGVAYSPAFPVAVGPDLTPHGGEDAFVAKINATGTALVYLGYIGGSNDDQGHGIAVDAAGNAYITGSTTSTEATFPVKVGPDLTFNGGRYDAFVAKVNTAATALVYAGYVGGSGLDVGTGLAVDAAGNAYVTGFTASTADFPVTVGPDLTFNGGTLDAFVAKVNAAGTALVYAGYIGGSGDDPGNGIAVDAAGNAYLTGSTTSTEATFPVMVGPRLISSTLPDAFVVKVNAAGTALVYAGYIGGGFGNGIAVDSAGNAYVTGYTGHTEAAFPVAVGPDLTFNGYYDAFVAKVNVAGTALVYAGYIGGSGWDQGVGIAVDAIGNAYVTGFAQSTQATFPVTVGPDLTYNGGFGSGDAFVAKVSAVGTLSVACPPHRVHGHISTVPPSHSGNVSHQHHGQHGHTVAPNCPPHAPGHSAGLFPEPEETVFAATGPRQARRAAVLELVGSAEGLYLEERDEQPAGMFTAPASGSPLYYTTTLPEVRIGGTRAQVWFSGLAPGVKGVWQINVVTPPHAASGPTPLSISYEGAEIASFEITVIE